MFESPQDTTQNQLLRILSSEDWARLAADLEAVEIEPRTVLGAPGAPAAYVYFPEAGVVSLLADFHGRVVEVGLYGAEGFSGASLVLGVDRVGHEQRTQTPVRALRIAAESLRDAVAASPALHAILLRYVHVKLVQAAETAAANALYTVEQRLARWLLMHHDRLGAEDLPVTHETLGVSLGVRRSSVTVALHRLEGARLVSAKRGRIVVLDRPGLQAVALASYGGPEAEYDRLLGGFRQSSGG